MSISNILKKLNRRDTKLLPKFSKKSKTILFFILIVFLAFFASRILAVDNIIKDTQDAQEAKNNAESWQENAWNTTAVNGLTTITGKLTFNADGTVSQATFAAPGGLIGNTNKLIGSIYNQPPASGIQYIAQIKDNFLGRQTYAQGVNIGNNGRSLQPLLPAWKGFRNIVYGLFSIVFVIIGIMIMLRIKISPQAVITIQASIPKIVTALIMVTFSYAIAGLLIDLSYVIQGLAISFFFQIKGLSLTSELFNSRYQQFGLQTKFSELNNASFDRLSNMVQGVMPYGSLFDLSTSLGAVAFGGLTGGLLSGALGSWGGTALRTIGEVIGYGVGTVGGVLMLLLFGIFIGFWLIKLWFGLLKTYALIIVQIITGPFIIAMGAFPNSKMGFGSWLIQLISRIAVFPVVLVTAIGIQYLSDITEIGTLWSPRLLDQTVATNGGNLLPCAIALTGLAMLSKLPTLVPELIFKLKPSGFGKAIGENMTAVVTNSGKYGKYGADAGLNKASTKWGDNSYVDAGTAPVGFQQKLHKANATWRKYRKIS